MPRIDATDKKIAEQFIILRPYLFGKLKIGDKFFKELLTEAVKEALEEKYGAYNNLIEFLNGAISKNSEVYDYLEYYLQRYPVCKKGENLIQLKKLHENQKHTFFCDLTMHFADSAEGKKNNNIERKNLFLIAIGLGIQLTDKNLSEYKDDEEFQNAISKANNIKEISNNPALSAQLLSSLDEMNIDDDEFEPDELPDPDLVLNAIYSYFPKDELSLSNAWDLVNDSIEKIINYYPDNKKIVIAITKWVFPAIRFASDDLKNNLTILKFIVEFGYNHCCPEYEEDTIFNHIRTETAGLLSTNSEFAKLSFLSDIFYLVMMDYEETIKFDKETIYKRMENLDDYPEIFESPETFNSFLRHVPDDLLYDPNFTKQLYAEKGDEWKTSVDQGLKAYFQNNIEYANKALLLAVMYDHLEVVKLLLERADVTVNHSNEDGDTALFIAVCNNNIEMVNLLLNQKGLDFFRKDLSGNNIVHRIAMNSNTAAFEAILNHCDFETTLSLLSESNNSGASSLSMLSSNDALNKLLESYLRKKRDYIEENDTSSKHRKIL